MKTSIVVLLCSFLIGCSSAGNAAVGEVQPLPELKINPLPFPLPQVQQPPKRKPGTAIMISRPSVCNESKFVYKSLKDGHNQVPVLWGMQNDQAGNQTVMLQVFTETSTGKYTIVESSTNGFSCILTIGVDLDVLPHEHPQQFQQQSN